MPITGDACTAGGTYRSGCRCELLTVLAPGLYFPSCIQCGKRVPWALVTDERQEPKRSGLFVPTKDTV